jgi:hypothetical protein
MEVSGQLHAPATLPPGKNPCCPLDRRLEGPQSWSGRGGEEKNSHHCPCQELKPCGPARSLVTILTELPRWSLKKQTVVLLHSGCTSLAWVVTWTLGVRPIRVPGSSHSADRKCLRTTYTACRVTRLAFHTMNSPETKEIVKTETGSILQHSNYRNKPSKHTTHSLGNKPESSAPKIQKPVLESR